MECPGSPLLLVLALLATAAPRHLLAEDCPSSYDSSVRLSASSYRNLTGHWVTKASLARGSTSDVSSLWHEERPLQYGVEITRQSCGGDETLTTTFSVVAPPARVGSDYRFFPNVGYYKLHTDKMSWEDARRTCAKEGAHLAVVNSEAEENAIRDVMRTHSKENFAAFIGFHDRLKEGDYVTVLERAIAAAKRENTSRIATATRNSRGRRLHNSDVTRTCRCRTHWLNHLCNEYISVETL